MTFLRLADLVNILPAGHIRHNHKPDDSGTAYITTMSSCQNAVFAAVCLLPETALPAHDAWTELR